MGDIIDQSNWHFPIISKIQDRFTSVDGFPMAISQTGEPYVEILVKGSDFGKTYVDFVSELNTYLSDKNGYVYWRCRPDYDTERNVHKFYARLLASDKPMKWANYMEYDLQTKPKEAA